jgi:two-component system, NarL family, nitrate/nitrite response regulator NarL
MTQETLNAVAHELTKQGTQWSPGQTVSTILICTNSLLRMGLKHLLAGTCFAVSDTAVDETSRLPCGPDATPTLVIVEASYSTGETAEAVRHLKAQHPEARVVVVADHFETHTVMELHRAGVDGCCLTSSSRELLIKSLELVMLGQTVLPSAMVLAILREAGHPKRPSESIATIHNSNSLALNARKISPREAEILGLLKEGMSNKVIAQQLDVAEATVKVHVKAILRKIGAANRTQAAMWATEHLPRRDGSSQNG